MRGLLAFLAFMGISAAHGADYVDCPQSPAQGQTCWAHVEDLHPTQMSVGQREVESKARALRKKSDSSLTKYLEGKISPLVIGPRGIWYLTDGHHLGNALLRIGKGRILVQVRADLSCMRESGFWQTMQDRHWVYLFDEKGRGPISPYDLPGHLQDMKNDVYRSLAGEVRDAGGYGKTDIYFADFQWADFFRSRIDLTDTDAGFRTALKEALRLAGSPEARDLPGFIGHQ